MKNIVYFAVVQYYLLGYNFKWAQLFYHFNLDPIYSPKFSNYYY